MEGMSLMQSVPGRSDNDTSGEAPAPPRSATFRAVMLGLLLLPLNAYWIVQMERVRYSAHPTTVSLFFNTIFILVVLSGINALVGKSPLRRWRFQRGELLLVYSMLCIGSCMAAHDFGQVLIPLLTWPYHMATTTNQYHNLLQPFLPKAFMVTNEDAVRGFYLGQDTFYTKEHFLAWLPAILVWTGFVGVLLFTMQCVNVIIRKQWAEHEHLSFPLAKIPLEVTNVINGEPSQGKIFTANNKLFWLGFVLAVGMDFMNSLNYYYPTVPAILTPGSGQSMDLATYVKTPPWSAIGWTPLAVYPFIVGLGMLMPIDFLFSSWFFYIFWKLQLVAVSMFGWNTDSQMPYANGQSFGAYMLFFTSTLWLSRNYLKQVVACALGRKSDLDDRDEPLTYRGAFLGLAIGLGALVAFTMAIGMSWWLAIAFFVIYLALALAITRMRVELGTPVHDLHFTGPDYILTSVLGPHAIGAQNTAIMSLFYWFNRAYRGHPMPHQMEAFRLAELTGARGEMRKWFGAILLAGVAGMLCAFWAMLTCYYHYGAQAKIQYTFGPDGWDRYVGWMKGYQPQNAKLPAAIVVGYLFATFLQVMRVRYSWWPFHPLAYAVTSSWEINLLWLSLFIAWAVKSTILRYGGVGKYQQSLPFFYGLILGQFIFGSLLNIWGIVTETPTFQFWQ